MLPIVALTSYVSNKVEQECHIAGMDDICMKSYYIYIYIYLYIYIYIDIYRLFIRF